MKELDLPSLLKLIAGTPIDERYPSNPIFGQYHDAILEYYNRTNTTEEDKSIIVIALNMTHTALIYGYMDYQRRSSMSNYNVMSANELMPKYLNDFKEYQKILKEMIHYT
jgi:hypothetical protein